MCEPGSFSVRGVQVIVTQRRQGIEQAVIMNQKGNGVCGWFSSSSKVHCVELSGIERSK